VLKNAKEKARENIKTFLTDEAHKLEKKIMKDWKKIL
jgi:hypothetical protein